jgi:hypothetical protein
MKAAIRIISICFILATFVSESGAQFLTDGNSMFIRTAGAAASYFGDRNSVNDDLPFFSHSYMIGAGYFINEGIAVGLDYRVGNYPRRIHRGLRGYTQSHTANLYMQYSFRPDRFLDPYVIGGLGMTFYGTYNKDPEINPAFGPMLGAGVKYEVSNRISVFVESRVDFILDDLAMDQAAGKTGFDALGFFGGGIKIKLRPDFQPIRGVAITGPDEVNRGQSFMLVARLQGEPTGPLQFEWDLGDGNRAIGSNIAHVYTASNEYTVTLRVSNRRGSVSTVREIVVVSR